MPRLFIPSLNDALELTEPWTFGLYHEYRNLNMLGVFCDTPEPKARRGHYDPETKEWVYPPITPAVEAAEAAWREFLERHRNTKDSTRVTLPVGTVLTVRRIYIRNGAVDFNSVTFSIKKCPDKKLKGRFWVKLYDVNTMVVADTDPLRDQQVATAVIRAMTGVQRG